MKTSPLLSLGLWAVTLAAPSYAADPATVNTNRSTIAPTPRDGFTFAGTQLVLTRKGVTENVSKETILPNGIRVSPDGRVRLSDGSTASLRANQILTLDGQIEDTLIMPNGVAPVSSVAITPPAPAAPGSPGARDGLSMRGNEAYLTRDGVTQKVTSEIRLPSGIVAQPGGTVTLANGTRVTLEPGQILGLDGVLREAPRTNGR